VQTVRLLVDKVAIDQYRHVKGGRRDILVLRNELPSYVIWLNFGGSSRRSWGIDNSRSS
jgi:hypothetical protein